jgi:hypothetical protein
VRTPSLGAAYGFGTISYGQTAVASYFALPFTVPVGFSPRYAGVGLPARQPAQPTATAPASIGIYSDNGGAPGAALVTGAIFGTWFQGGTFASLGGGVSVVDLASGTPQVPLEVYLGPSAVQLGAGTHYWLVISYPASTAPPEGFGIAGVAFSVRKMSGDGKAWVNWIGTNGGFDGDATHMPALYVSN